MFNLLSSTIEMNVTKITISESLLYALIGFAVTFLGIAVLIFFVWITGKFFDAVNKRPKKVEKKEKTVEESPGAPIVQDGIPEEIVVAITAAIATYYEGEKSSCEFKVKRIKRL